MHAGVYLIQPGLHPPTQSPLIWWKFLPRHVKPRMLGHHSLVLRAEIPCWGERKQAEKVVATTTQCQLIERGCHSRKKKSV